jgi:hypothetical protein
VEVAAIDERDLDGSTPELRDRLQAAETSADDDDVVFRGHVDTRNAVGEVHTVLTISDASVPS